MSHKHPGPPSPCSSPKLPWARGGGAVRKGRATVRPSLVPVSSLPPALGGAEEGELPLLREGGKPFPGCGQNRCCRFALRHVWLFALVLSSRRSPDLNLLPAGEPRAPLGARCLTRRGGRRGLNLRVPVAAVERHAWGVCWAGDISEGFLKTQTKKEATPPELVGLAAPEQPHKSMGAAFDAKERYGCAVRIPPLSPAFSGGVCGGKQRAEQPGGASACPCLPAAAG